MEKGLSSKMGLLQTVGFLGLLVFVVGLEERPIQVVQLVPENDNQLLELIKLYETGYVSFYEN